MLARRIALLVLLSTALSSFAHISLQPLAGPLWAIGVDVLICVAAALSAHLLANDALRPINRLAEHNQTLLDRNLNLQQANEMLEQLSITDGLTQLHNHRFFQDHLTQQIKRVSRTHEPLSLLLADIDDFKLLNDRFGHAAGDELLRRLAAIMSDSIRDSDLLARYGGEEFAILADDTDLLGAYQVAEKLRTAVSETSYILGESRRPARVTVSVGVSQYDGNRKKFFEVADRALYQAKAIGKNCVVMGGREDEVL
jgi:diguanylate cyclase (GGDEF)-like protein